jgi:cyclic beta-1,2-glucan synthetase
VRENGGQYTHAALWLLMAYAELGDGERATELFSLLNPINHTSTPAGLYKYKVEPYVAAADIYGMHPHIGRGGWTWYTGSSSWMYRAALESILGFNLQGDKLYMRPRVSKLWREFTIDYRHKETPYTIRVMNREDGNRDKKITIEFDGKITDSDFITLLEDKKPHNVVIRL